MRSLKKWLPKPHELQNHSNLAVIKDYLFSPVLWYFSRRTVAKGFAIGLLIAFLPAPGQMFIAALLAIWFRANLPIAVIATWITNPLTFLPINFFIYKVGQWVLHDTGKIPFFSPDFSWEEHHWREIFSHFIQWLKSLGKPYLVGLPIVSISASIIAYFATHLLWKIAIYWRWHKKKIKKHRSH